MYSSRLTILSNVYMSIMFATCCSFNYLTGGIGSPSLWLLLLCPHSQSISCSRKSTLFWLIAAASHVVSLTVLWALEYTWYIAMTNIERAILMALSMPMMWLILVLVMRKEKHYDIIRREKLEKTQLHLAEILSRQKLMLNNISQ